MSIIHRNCRRILAFVLLLVNVNLEVFAEESPYASYLDGWKVQAAWSTLSTDYTWNAETDSTRQPKIVVTYRMKNAEKDYPAGALKFTIPGIGNATRGFLNKADKLAADQEDSEWTYEWNQGTDVYTFTNKFEVKKGQSVSGGFELLWTLHARDCEDGFSKTASPVFTIDGVGSIQMEPLSYQFTSKRDRYRISLQQNILSTSEYEDADKNYVWYNFDTRFDSDRLSRGLYKSDYFMSVELPDGVSDSDMIVQRDGKTVSLTRNENHELGFYLFRDWYGDVTSSLSSVTLGFKQNTLDGKTVTVRGHLDRLYQDETEWIRTAGTNECVDAEKIFTVTGYRFDHNGYIYYHAQHNRYEDSYTHQAPKSYANRLPATGLFNGKIVEFELYGAANRSYSMGRKATARRVVLPDDRMGDADILSDTDAVSDWNDLNWKENGLVSEGTELEGISYGELHPSDVMEIPDEDEFGDLEILPGGTSKKDPIATDSNVRQEKESDEPEETTETEAIPEPDETVETEKTGHVKETEAAEATEETETPESVSDMLQSRLFGIFGKAKNLFMMSAMAAETNVKISDEDYTREATHSDAEEDTDDKMINPIDLTGATAGTQTKPGGNTSGHSQVGENQEYALVMGHDKFAIGLNDGTIRALENDEYDIAYVTIPGTFKAYDYEIFGAADQETHFDDFILIGTGNTGSYQRITLPEGVKSVFIRVHGITGSYSYNAYVGVRFHLDWSTEKEKPESEQVNRDGKLTSFSYLRSLYIDENGYEVNDCVVQDTNYKQEYGVVLAERDQNLYQEYLMRDYSHAWLRNPVTNLTTTARIDEATGTPKNGFQTALYGSGTMQAENEGPLQNFSLYLEIPSGMSIDPNGSKTNGDSAEAVEVSVSGQATLLTGDKTTDFSGHVDVSERDNAGKHYLVCDFDFSDSPLDASKKVSVNVKIPASLAYADFLANGSKYVATTYLMPHDEGLDCFAGPSIKSDEFDLDGNGSTTDLMAYASHGIQISDDATEWREFVSKYIKSAYSAGYTNETVTRMYNAAENEEQKKKSDYSYQLDFGLGSSNAKNIVFFDRIEQGAVLAQAGDSSDKEKTIPSAWQGTFLSVDTSQAEKLGLVPTVYYSENPNQAFDLSASGWTTVKPSDPAKIKTIAVSMDTSGIKDGVLKTKQLTYVTVNMRAPSNRNLIDKKAVNQYTVQYDAYGLTNDFEETYVLPSAETYIRLLDNIGRIVLHKVDADNLLKTDEDGTKHYASLTGARIQVYDPNGKPLFEGSGKTVTSLGNLVLNNVRTGTYSWEETEAPLGYQKIAGKHKFKVGDIPQTIEIPNKRIPGSVTLTKLDSDAEVRTLLADAEYGLYQTDGTRVPVTGKTGNYAYNTSESSHLCRTGADGTVTVTGLPWGHYYLKEETAPAAYELNTEELRFQIGKEQCKDGAIHVSLETGDSEKTASIRLTKTDAISGKTLKNAYYDVYVQKNDDSWKKIYEYQKTNAAGELLIGNLKFGRYRFTEVIPPAGYKLATGSVETELNASTADTIVKISQTDERKTGSVRLVKASNDGMPLADAVFDLYKKAKKPEAEDTLVRKEMKTGADGTTETVNDLTWGDYYFREIKAPDGYRKSETDIAFTVDASTADSVQTIRVSNNRLLGTVILTKMDEATKSKKLFGAEFSLYRNNGTLVKTGLVTGADGTVTVENLEWGSYYFEETKAPDGYSLTDAKVRFSVNNENCMKPQQLICYDPVGLAEIKINKTINDWYESFGPSTFLFEISGKDVSGAKHTWVKSITLTDGNLTGSTVLSGIPAGTYQVTEKKVSRYTLVRVTGDKNITVTGMTATADLRTQTQAEVSFENHIKQYEKFTHTGNAANLVNTETKLTALQVTYKGAPVIQSETESSYTFTKNDLEAVAFYDDGSSQKITFGQLVLDPATVTGNNNSSGAGYTVTVSYTENDITVSDGFSIQIALQLPPQSFTVTYNANGGYFGEDVSKTLHQVTYDQKAITVTKIAKTDNVNANGSSYSGGYGNNVSKNQVITIPGAKKLKITITYATQPTFLGNYYDWVSIYQGKDIIPSKNNSEQSISGKLGGGGNLKTKKEFEIEGDTAQFYFCSNGALDNYYGFYAEVQGIIYEYDFTNVEKIIPNHPTGIFLGWYTDPACSDGNEFVLTDWDEDVTVYAKWRSLTATFNNNLKSIIQDPKTITAFQHSDIKPPADIMSGNAHIISTLDSETPIYIWRDGDAVKWWSKAEMVYAPRSAYKLFDQCSRLKDISGVRDWNTTNMQTMSYMFSGCSSLTDLTDLASWDTSKMTYMDSMFQGCSGLTDLTGLASWNTSKMTYMSGMFQDCSNLTNLTPLTSWNTGNVTSMNCAFWNCSGLNNLEPLASWNTDKVTNMSTMFYGCKSLTDLNGLASWNTGNVTSMDEMFWNCSGLNTLNGLASWDTSKATNMSSMFSGCRSLTNLTGLASWNTTNVTSMYDMFHYCSALTVLTGLASWDTGKATNMSSMFQDCSSLTNLDGLASWNTGNVSDMNYIFSGCKKLTDASAINEWDITNVKSFSYMFHGCPTHPTFTKRVGTWGSDGTFTPTS